MAASSLLLTSLQPQALLAHSLWPATRSISKGSGSSQNFSVWSRREEAMCVFFRRMGASSHPLPNPVSKERDI